MAPRAKYCPVTPFIASVKYGRKLKFCPTNVLSWHNVAAEDDYTCHDNTLCNDFKAMLKQKHVSCIRDYQVYNLAVRYGKSNPHSSVGYYIHPRVSLIISDWLTRDGAG